MALPTFPAIEQFEGTDLTLLRYLYDALSGFTGTGGAGAGSGIYNKPVGTKKTNSGVHTIPAGTTNSIMILALSSNATYSFGGSVSLVAPVGVPIYLKASTLFSLDIVITAGAGMSSEVHITEMQPQ